MNLFFDLDGTLTDSYPGIVNSFLHTAAAMGCPPPAAETLKGLIGPPLLDGLAAVLGTADTEILKTARNHYRDYFGTTGMYENEVYPGIRTVLEQLTAEGHDMWVVTSKTVLFAGRIVDHFGLTRFFKDVIGSSPDGRVATKTEMIGGLMARAGLSAAETVMIGDRKHDIIGARDNGIGAVGVLWGYGDAEELRGAGAHALCRAQQALPETIRRIWTER